MKFEIKEEEKVSQISLLITEEFKCVIINPVQVMKP